MPSAGAPWTGLSASLLSPLAKSNSYPNVASSLSSSTPMAMTNPPGGAFRQGFSSSTPYPPPDCYTGCDNTSLSMLHDKINMQSKVEYLFVIFLSNDAEQYTKWLHTSNVQSKVAIFYDLTRFIFSCSKT